MPKNLFDIPALQRHRRRARHSASQVRFLHDIAAGELSERLTEVNRTFTNVAIVTGFPEIWAHHMPAATLIADTEVLDLAPRAFDLVIHAMSLHWANDLVGQMIQCRHALRPDGLFLAAMLGGRTLNELRTALAEAESRVCGGLSPRVIPMADLRDLGGLLLRAGFALPVADATVLPVSYASMPDLMQDLRLMGETNAMRGRPRHFASRGLFQEAAKIYSRSFADADLRLMATFEMIYLTGWAPDPGQQQPMRPGSAQARLADALGTKEIPANDIPAGDPVPE